MATIDLNAESIPVDSPFLPLIQGNILRGFGRDHSRWIFFRLGTDPAVARSTLASLAGYVTTAQQQELWRQEKNASEPDPCQRYKASRTKNLYGNLFLSRAGYDAIGLANLASELSRREFHLVQHELISAERKLFQGGLFEPGMASSKSASALKDSPGNWSKCHFDPSRPWSAMLLLTSDDEERLELALSEVLPIVQDNHVEVGRVLRDEQCRPREHFGYLDGRSQPLFFKDALDKDTSVARWKPAAPLKLALIADPGAEDKGGYGSFLVFRKLQQDVAQFDAMVGDLAQAIDPAEPDLARAGAMLMGRFKDGTPLVLSDKPEALPVPANDFDHKTEDPHFLRCPAFAHTRRSNPRSDQPDQTTKVQQSRIARRGVPYGEPGDKEVGLLFAAFMSSIVGQFVTIQRSWANTPHFMLGQPGIDPVIGQGAANPDQDFPKHWNGVPDDSRKTFRLEHAVTLLGGDYFFAPSIPFLDSLKDPA